MQIMRKFSIGLAVALALASVAAASASASQRSFAASQYPATMVGIAEGEPTFITQHNGGRCEASMAASLPSEKPIVSAEYYMNCTKFGIYSGELKANGCRFELNADYNTVDIGPAGCGPMTMQQQTCTTYILPQNGIPATYGAGPTEGGFSTLKVSVATSKLKYRECTSTGELREDGTLNASFRIRGKTQAGAQISLSLTNASYVNLLSAEKYPATLSSNTGKTGEGLFSFGSAGTARCAATYSGTLASVWEYAELVPTFSGCSTFGVANGTVNPNGCKFSLSVLTGNQIINCPAGKAVTVAGPPSLGCEASIGSQEGLAGGKSENTTAPNGRAAVNLEYNMSGLKYTVTNDSGFLCGFEGTGAKSGGSFASHTVLLEGQDSAGPIAIKKGA